jgi:hypothetical protein
MNLKRSFGLWVIRSVDHCCSGPSVEGKIMAVSIVNISGSGEIGSMELIK